jgi:hypothetical protein
MKKLRLLLALFLLVILVTGCGGGGKTESGEAVIGKDKGEVTDESGKTTTGSDADLPKSYPKDLVPLLKPVEITSVSESHGEGIVVVFLSKAGVQEAVEYYSKVMEGASDKHVTSDSDFGLVGGIKASKRIAISITAVNEDGFNSVISINIE